jgi:hypothetical protein
LSIDGIKDGFNSMTSGDSGILSSLNRETIITALSKNTNLKKDDLETYADRIEDYINNLTEKIKNADMDSFKKGVEDYVSNFLDSTQRQELNYDDLKRDLKASLDNPKDTFDILKNRFSKFDADTVKALITNNKYISEENIDDINGAVTDVLKQVQDKIKSIEQKAHEQIEMVKRKAVIQAENIREIAASAAWWLVVTIMISAGAAMLGGWIEIL